MRRAFCIVAGLLASAVGPTSSGRASAADTSSPGKAFLSIEGTNVGYLNGAATQTQTASGYDERLTFTPWALSSFFYSSWISPALSRQRPLKSVSLTTTDYDLRPTAELDATGAVLAEIDFPALDSLSKDAVNFAVRFSTPSVTTSPITGGTPSTAPSPMAPVMSQNFKLSIDGLDATRVTKIEAITVTSQPYSTPRSLPVVPTTTRSATPLVVLPAATLTFSHLVVYVASATAAGYQQWLLSAGSTTKSGSIAYLKADMSTGATLALSGLGITAVTPLPVDPRGNQVAVTKIDMTIGGAQFSVP